VIDEKTKERLITKDYRSAAMVKPFLVGKDLKRYEPPPKNKYVIFIPKGWTRVQISHSRENGNPETTGFRIKSGMTETAAWKWFSDSYPAIAEHLESYAEKGKKRYDKGEYWWELRACDYYAEFEKPKIMLPDISLRGNFTYDNAGNYCVNTAYVITNADYYLLGILNSHLVHFIYKGMSSTYRGGYLRFIYQYLERIPIKAVDFNNLSEKAIHDQLVSLVDSMLELNKKKTSLPASSEREKIEREITITDEKIDEIVYGLYGITEEERKIMRRE
jgi:hypothetical protein